MRAVTAFEGSLGGPLDPSFWEAALESYVSGPFHFFSRIFFMKFFKGSFSLSSVVNGISSYNKIYGTIGRIIN